MADFLAQNGAAIKNVCREFIVLCRGWSLFTEVMVAIDGLTNFLKGMFEREK